MRCYDRRPLMSVSLLPHARPISGDVSVLSAPQSLIRDWVTRVIRG